MQLWPEVDKRKAPRFEIDIPVVSYSNFPYIEFRSKVHDISSQGIGIIAVNSISPGSLIDVVLIMPQIQDRARLRARVIWVQNTGPNCYRLGAELLTTSFNPLPYVLKTLHNE